MADVVGVDNGHLCKLMKEGQTDVKYVGINFLDKIVTWMGEPNLLNDFEWVVPQHESKSREVHA